MKSVLPFEDFFFYLQRVRLYPLRPPLFTSNCYTISNIFSFIYSSNFLTSACLLFLSSICLSEHLVSFFPSHHHNIHHPHCERHPKESCSLFLSLCDEIFVASISLASTYIIISLGTILFPSPASSIVFVKARHLLHLLFSSMLLLLLDPLHCCL